VPSLDDAAVSMLRPPTNVYGIFRFRGAQRGALPRPDTERGCYRLPTSSGHGYPVERRAYQLAWEDLETEANFVPTYDLGGYATAELGWAWYGHGGALSQRPGSIPAQSEAALDVEITYDERGRMASETVRRESPEGPSLVYRRTRSFGQEGLVDDVLEVERRGPEAAQEEVVAHRRTLTFDRDQSGRLQTRTLRVDGTAVSRQEFGYDDRGRWTRLESYGRPETLTPPTRWSRDVSRPVDASPESSFEQTATYRRRYDDQGRKTLQRWEVPNSGYGGYRGSYRKKTEWGPHGPTRVRIDRPSVEDAHVTRRQFRYDEQGRKVRMSVDDDGDPALEHVERWEWRGERLEAHIVEDRERGETETTRYRYACGKGG
jgi:hypothetical protein